MAPITVSVCEKYCKNLFRVTQAIDDSDCLLLYCDYTNNSSSSSSALVDVQLSAKQNGEKLSPAVPKEDEPAIDNYIPK